MGDGLDKPWLVVIHYVLLKILARALSPIAAVLYGYWYVFFVGYALVFFGHYFSVPLVVIPFFAFGVILNRKLQRVESVLRASNPNRLIRFFLPKPPKPSFFDKFLMGLDEDGQKRWKLIRNYFYGLVAVIFLVIAVAGYFGKVPEKEIEDAQATLQKFKSNNCKLYDHERQFSKYRLRPVWVNRKDRQDAVRYVTDDISVSRKRRYGTKKVNYFCKTGGLVTSKYRFRELMVKENQKNF